MQKVSLTLLFERAQKLLGLTRIGDPKPYEFAEAIVPNIDVLGISGKLAVVTLTANLSSGGFVVTQEVPALEAWELIAFYKGVTVGTVALYLTPCADPGNFGLMLGEVDETLTYLPARIMMWPQDRIRAYGGDALDATIVISALIMRHVFGK